ncbi:hypothetical protein [Winogradskyella vincentii]|uniref:Uncharacterized protein n=1 Tax=Winogradskyella vincentii TaxID=2877122 RepID=A0ABS7Y2D3_9FLAO|nr:hypothetical protein [Winogradskyella vincentii]MCA0154096.1 hypothetical protein [Winogradskyella vincentii]
MKTSPFLYIAITTLILITITVMSAMDFPFGWVFYLTVLGQVFLVVMVYKVLTDDYKTDKTFDHFYEDRPIEPLELRAENETEKFRL